MTVGIRIENDHGGIQVNEQLIAWGQVGTGSVTLVNDNMTHPQPIVVGEISVSGGFPVIAIRPRGGKAVGVTFVSQLPGGGYKYALMCQSNSNVTVDWWAFDSAANATKDPTMQSVNLVVKDEFGAVTFDASMPHLRVVAGLAPGMSSNPLGTDDHSTEASISTPSGKSYAVIISTIGHTATMYDTGNYSSGSPSTQPEESETLPGGGGGGPPMDASWREMVLKTYLGMVSFDGLTFRMGMTQFEVFQGWYPMGQTPHLIHHGSPSFTVIDVTGYGGGTGGGAPVIAVNVNNWTPTASGAAGSDIISPPVTASASGGVGPYYYQWYYDSGSTAVTYHSAADANPVQLRSPATPANTTRVARWRVKATDANGDTGWSEPVEFRFIGGAGPDYVPDAITPFTRFDVSSNDPDVTWNGAYRQVTGINQPITLRFERYDYVGNMAALFFDVFTAPASSGPWTHHGYFTASGTGFAYLDVVVTDGTWLAYNAHAATDSGRRTATCTMTVWNRSDPGGPVKISDVTNNVFVVDADDNFNVSDPNPDVMTWPDVSWSTNENNLYGAYISNGPTVTGINQTIRLRFQFTSASSDTTWQNLEIVNHQHQVYAVIENFQTGSWVDVDVVNGSTFILKVSGGTNSGRRTAGGTVSVTNMTTGASLGSFTVGITVDADNNYNVNPLAVSVANSYSYDYQFVGSGTYYEISAYSSPTVSGGTAPYTYKWTRLNGPVAIQSSTMLNPRFSYYARASWSVYSEYQLEVTDAAGAKAYGYFTADWSAGDIEV